jgi:hypothetical protein
MSQHEYREIEDTMNITPKERELDAQDRLCVYKFNMQGLAINEKYGNQNNILSNFHRAGDKYQQGEDTGHIAGHTSSSGLLHAV